MRRRGLVVLNPAARGVPQLERVQRAFAAAAGWDLTLERTDAKGQATELARDAAARGLDAVVACGGDGTVNEVANGLAGSEAALAVVRCGTANVWAKEIGVPKAPERALGVLQGADVRTVDLGRAGDRYFLALAGVGFDAAVVRAERGWLKRRLGAASYVLQGLSTALRHRTVEVDAAANGDSLSGGLYWLLLGNTRSWGGVLNVTDHARADDGRLDLCLMRRGGPHRLAWLGLLVLLARHHASTGYRTVASLDIRTPGLPVEVDGEYLGETPMRFETAPGALRVVVPRGLQSPLFTPSARRT